MERRDFILRTGFLSAFALATVGRLRADDLAPVAPSSIVSQPAPAMTIHRNASRPSTQGSPEYFTGSVRIDPLKSPEGESRLLAANVTFEPGARTAWHTHPLGQTLIVVSGLGRVQCEGGPIEEIRPGDVVWFPPGEKHWHGAAPEVAMTHIAIQEALEGKVVDWMEHVTDSQYTG